MYITNEENLTEKCKAVICCLLLHLLRHQIAKEYFQ